VYDIRGDFAGAQENFINSILIDVTNNENAPRVTIPLNKFWEIDAMNRFAMYGFEVQNPKEILDNPSNLDGVYVLKLRKGDNETTNKLYWEEEFRLISSTFISTLEENSFSNRILFEKNTSPNKPVPDPSMESHNFLGWFTGDSGGTPFDFTIPRRDDVYIFAQWAIKQYRIFYSSYKPLPEGFDNPQIVDHGQYIPRPSNEWENIDQDGARMDFLGWFYNSDFSGSPVDFDRPIQASPLTEDFGDGETDGRLELFANWDLATHEVFIKYWNGESLGSTRVISGNPLPYDILEIISVDFDPNLQRPLSLHIDFDGEEYGDIWELDKPVVEDDLELFAKYKYLVQYVDEHNTTIEVWAEFGTLLDDIKPEAEGFNFLGWLVDDEKFDFGTPVREPIVLTADWEAVVVDDTGNFWWGVFLPEGSNTDEFEINPFVPEEITNRLDELNHAEREKINMENVSFRGWGWVIFVSPAEFGPVRIWTVAPEMDVTNSQWLPPRTITIGENEYIVNCLNSESFDDATMNFHFRY
jgi:hypothetical protein